MVSSFWIVCRQSPKGYLTTLFYARCQLKSVFGHITHALNRFSQSNGALYRRKMFVDDAAHGIAFIDVCRKKYDVVLMNPPFGRIIAIASYKSLLKRYYPHSWTDYFLAFIARSREFSTPNGISGSVVPNRLMDAKKSSATRETLSTQWPAFLMVDCGGDVMDDAAVDAVLLVAPSTLLEHSPSCFFISTKSVPPDERAMYLARWTNRPKGLHSLSTFRQIPGTPFAYSRPPELLQLWRNGHRLEPDLASVVTGGKTFDDERFLRLRWEVNPTALADRWLSVDTGGDYQPWVSPSAFVEDWENGGQAVRENAIARYGTDAQVMQSSKFWFKPGIAYPYTTSIGFGPRIFPSGTILSTDAIAISPNEGVDPIALLGAVASSWTGELLSVFGDHRKTENSSVKSLPFHWSSEKIEEFTALARMAIQHLLQLETFREVSAYFLLPPQPGDLGRIADSITQLQTLIDEACHQMFSIPRQCSLSIDHRKLVPAFVSEPTRAEHFNSWLSYCVGGIFGRWDMRVVVDQGSDHIFPNPFDRLLLCSPGMLQGSNGLPADETPEDYPIPISWDGILVDDAGFDGRHPHRNDILCRLREALGIIWKDNVHEIEQDASGILDVSDLREYFRKPTGFFHDHLKRYSKSHRKAPIYWQLATSSCSYAVWLYYCQFTKDTFYKVLNDYVNPKLREEEHRLISLRQDAGPNPTAGQRKDIAAQETFVEEIRTFRDEVARIAPLWSPDLHDGVIINFAPLWRLVPQHRQWQKECKESWDKLVKGDYDWAHLAMHLWPERVVPKCVKDRSLAITHGLDEIFWEQGKDGKWHQKKVGPEIIQKMIRERTSATVKDALDKLLSAPSHAVGPSKSRTSRTRKK